MITGTVPLPRPLPAVEEERVSTRFVDRAGRVVVAGEWLIVLQESLSGQLEQFHVRSPNIDFRILIAVDGLSVFSKTYNEIRQIGQNSPEISSFAELDEDGDPTGYYVASLRNIPFLSSILVRVQNTGLVVVTFSQLFAKYTIRE